MKHARSRYGWLPALVLAASAAALPGGDVQAINPQPEPPRLLSLPVFGMIGIDSQSVLRLSVLNASDLVARPADTIILDPPQIGVADAVPVPDGGCNIEVSFLDGEGEALQEPVVATVAPGRATEFDFRIASRLGVSRMAVRPVIELAPSDKRICSLLNANVEVLQIDTTATGVFVNPLQYILINPQPEPPRF